MVVFDVASQSTQPRSLGQQPYFVLQFATRYQHPSGQERLRQVRHRLFRTLLPGRMGGTCRPAASAVTAGAPVLYLGGWRPRQAIGNSWPHESAAVTRCAGS